MSYFISLPKIKEKATFFRKVNLGPSNHIFPNLTILTVDPVWIKYIFSCILHKNLDLKDFRQINEIILNPYFGVYNRVITWSFEYASKNEDPPIGVIIAKRWNYGIKAREKGRDFFDIIGLGRLIKNILDTENPVKFLSDARKYSEGNFSEVSKDFFFIEETLRRIIGINLSYFSIRIFLREVFKHMKPEHFNTQRTAFVSLFIAHFIKQFRKTSDIEKKDIISDHPFFHYVKFVDKELKITEKKDLLKKLGRAEKDLYNIFPAPEVLKPILSNRGFDAFLILKLLKENAKKHFYSFIILTYLKRKNVNFKYNYLNIYKSLNRDDFQDHLKHLETALSRFGIDFTPLKLDNNLLKFLSIWWEYYQFAFIGEKITREIHRYLSDNLMKSKIRKRICEKDLEILILFLKNYIMSSEDYDNALRIDESYEQIILQLEEMKACRDLDSLFEYLFKLAKKNLQSFNNLAQEPFFPSLNSFERWVDELIYTLKITM